MKSNTTRNLLIFLILHGLSPIFSSAQSSVAPTQSTVTGAKLEETFAQQPTFENAEALNNAYFRLAELALSRKRRDSVQLILNKGQQAWLRVMPQNALTKAKAYLSVANFYDTFSDWGLADSAYTLANTWVLQTDSLDLIGITQLNHANVYQMRGSVEKAMKIVKEWEVKVPSFTNKIVQAESFRKIGFFYRALSKPETATLSSYYIQRALALAEAAYPPNDTKISRYFVAAVHDYRNRGKIDSAIVILKRMEVMSPQLTDYSNIWLRIAFADTYIEMKDFAQAKPHLNRALTIVRSAGWEESDNGQYTLYLLGQVALAEGQLAEAETYQKQALAVCKKLEYKIGIKQVLEELVKIAKQQGNYKTLSEYQQELLELELALAKENYSKTIAEKESQLNVSEKDNQIKAQQATQRFLWGGLTVAALVIGLIVWFYQRLRKQGRVLAQQNEVIDRQNKELLYLDAAKTRFFANISHELRTPLTLILGPLSILLKNSSLDDAARTQTNLAQANAQNLLKLVNEILDLSKLESGKLRVHETTVRFQPFISRLVSAFESHAEYLGVHYRLEYKAGEHLRLDLDVEKLEQIVNNLLSNALKFTPRGGSVFVKVEDLSNVMRLSVSDTGRGIHPDDLPYVFDRFYQTNQKDAPIEGGTGIGLALCRELAEVMQGRIWVESTLGKGSQFFVEFPKKEVLGVGNDATDVDTTEPQVQKTFKVSQTLTLALDSENTEGGILATETIGETITMGLGNFQSLPNLTIENTNPKTETILIVEDNRDLRTYITEILSKELLAEEGAHYTILETENGQQALDLLQDLKVKNQLPQLILSDIMMPVMDGFQLLKTLKDRTDFRHIPVVMLTARADVRDKLTALRIGVDDYLLKPFEPEELVVRIQNLLKNKAIREQAAVEVWGSENFHSLPNLSTTHEEQKTPIPLISAPDREWLENFEQYVQKHFASDILSVTFLADAFHMSESTLLRQLKRLTGLSPIQYLQEVRLNEARHLLEIRQYDSIAQVASRVGYADARTFSRSFKQRFGKLPSDFLSESVHKTVSREKKATFDR
ncbi:MAG: response regulator [Saprospiraceae bacterium]|nr:response regulator [Saprospiraceae bacterium]